jgi:hypothetical protein
MLSYVQRFAIRVIRFWIIFAIAVILGALLLADARAQLPDRIVIGKSQDGEVTWTALTATIRPDLKSEKLDVTAVVESDYKGKLTMLNFAVNGCDQGRGQIMVWQVDREPSREDIKQWFKNGSRVLDHAAEALCLHYLVAAYKARNQSEPAPQQRPTPGIRTL